MRFLADENFPGSVVATLLEKGHDVVWVRTTAPATKDADILSWAARENRILLTFDKDFGELALQTRLPTSCGVILFRTPMPPPTQVGVRLSAEIEARQDWAGNISVIEAGRVRMRKLKTV
jgi:predicted nuclease of predicted toxin-antitoxin system